MEKKDNLVQPVKLGTKSDGLHARVASAVNNPQPQGLTQGSGGIRSNRFVNFARIFILPDCSGSMAGEPIDMLKRAVDSYLDNCNSLVNKVGVASFPEQVYTEPVSDYNTIKQMCHRLEAEGGTPMSAAFGFVIDEGSPSHIVIISDGQPDSPAECIEIAKECKEKLITVDAVHIGKSDSGEGLMKQLAEITGGIYIKFTDVTSFAKSFAFLTPAKRTQLLTSKNPVALLGAAEVKL